MQIWLCREILQLLCITLTETRYDVKRDIVKYIPTRVIQKKLTHKFDPRLLKKIFACIIKAIYFRKLDSRT